MVIVANDFIDFASIDYLFCNPDLVNTYQKFIVSSLNIPLCITAFLGNTLIIAALQKQLRCLHPPSKLLLGCLASTDLCVGFIAQPLFVTHFISIEYFRSCRHIVVVGLAVGSILGGVSLLTLTAISVDRLLAIMLGLRYKQVVTLRRVSVFVVTLWISCTAVTMTFFYRLRITAVIMGVIVSSCTVTATFCYIKVFSILRRHQTAVQQQVQQAQPNGGEGGGGGGGEGGEGGGGEYPMNITRYKKTVSSALWVQLTLVACYLPQIIVLAVFAISGTTSPSLYITWSVATSLTQLNSSLNPFLYCWKIREVRQAVRDTIRQLWCFS